MFPSHPTKIEARPVSHLKSRFLAIISVRHTNCGNYFRSLP